MGKGLAHKERFDRACVVLARFFPTVKLETADSLAASVSHDYYFQPLVFEMGGARLVCDTMLCDEGDQLLAVYSLEEWEKIKEVMRETFSEPRGMA